MSRISLLLLALTANAQNNIDLVTQVPLSSFSLTSTQGAGIWGFSDPANREYAIMCTDGGTAVFDITNPVSPVEIGMVAPLNANPDKEVQIYVFDDDPFIAYAYVAHPGSGGGLQIIDLSNVPVSIAEVTPNWCPGFLGFTEATNVALGVKPSGFIGFVQGSNQSAGVFAVDISNPTGPCDLGSWDVAFTYDLFLSSNWYDLNFDGMELGVAFTGTSFYVIDLSDFYDLDPMTNSATTIGGYTPPTGLTDCRTGWMSRDGRYLFTSDQGDEPLGSNTAVRVFDMSDVTSPTLIETWTGPTQAIDHQVTVFQDFAFLANGTRGMVVLDATDPTTLQLQGDYDTFPANNAAQLDGAWESFFLNLTGIIATSDRSGGLFLLDPVLPTDICRTLDVGNDGFDLNDLALLYPNWTSSETVLTLSGLITTCL